MTKKEVLNQVKLKLNSGFSKQQTFDELDAYKAIPSIELAKIIKLLPTKSQKEKLKIIHYICLITYSGILGINIFQIMNGLINFSNFNTIIYLFISFFIFIGMSTFNPFFYIVSVLFTGISIFGLASKIGLNEEIVRSSKSFSAEEALKAGAIEAIAKDQEELLRLLAGKKVRLPQGEKTLAKAFLLSPLQMSAKQKFLHTIADPNISALLLTIGGLALYAEISAGFSLIIPGIVAILSFLLAFISLQTLPIQLGGTLLFFAGILFLIAEIFITSFGVLALAGVASIFLGGLFLIDPGAGTMRVSISLLLSLCAGIGAILGITAYLFTQERKKKVLPELLIETEGRVIALPTKENDDLALVQVGGEIWKFQCSDNLSLEDQVLIESREGMVLKGKKVQHKE